MSDMFLDTDTFDFFSLTDVVTDETAPAKPATTIDNVGADGGTVEDISDLANLYANEEAERAEEAEQDPNLNLADLADPNAEREAISLFEDLPDDAPLSIGGRALTKSEIAQALAKSDEVKKAHEILAPALRDIQLAEEFINQNYIKNQTAIEMNIQYLQDKANRATNDSEYAQCMKDLKVCQETLALVHARANEAYTALNQKKEATKNYRLFNSDEAMRQQIPNWYSIRGQVLQDAKEIGVNLDEVEKIYSPELATIFFYASQYKRMRANAEKSALERAKAKASRSPSSSATTQRTNATSNEDMKRQQLVNRMNNGGLDERQVSDMFNHLID